MKTWNSIFGLFFVLYGLQLILRIGGAPGYLRQVNLAVDPTGFGAMFVILGAWILVADRAKRGE